MLPDRRLYHALDVSLELGRKRLKELQDKGVINPQRTPTGRTLLSFQDAERLAAEI